MWALLVTCRRCSAPLEVLVRPLRSSCTHCGQPYRVRRGRQVRWAGEKDGQIEALERPEEVVDLDADWERTRAAHLYSDENMRTSLPVLSDLRSFGPTVLTLAVYVGGGMPLGWGALAVFVLGLSVALTFSGLHWRKAMRFQHAQASYRHERRDLWGDLPRAR